MHVLPACMSVQHVCDWFWQRLETDVDSLELDVCELPSRFWELSSGFLEEQSALLTDEPSVSSAPKSTF